MLHTGLPYREGNVALSSPVSRFILTTHHAEDVADSVRGWLRRAETQENIYYFSVEVEAELVGQIFLHDIDKLAGEALVGYHLFEPQWRGQGVGSQALKLLQRFVTMETTLMKLILITSADNSASWRAAEKAGFTYAGPPREDPTGVLLSWRSSNLSIQP